ncbi:META domain-containing protein [Stella sp.]|uniref:META domain-containing protein n=1 Tax=Stella sp. TaxID=2912054 RepID=UPI0035AFFCF5
MALRSGAAIVLAFGLGACATDEPAPPPGLAGTQWQATRLSDGSTVADPARLTIAFGTDGRAAIRADCNRGSGAWSSPAPGRIAFGAIATTRMACLAPSQGDRFLADLAAAARYRLRDSELAIAPESAGSALLLRRTP